MKKTNSGLGAWLVINAFSIREIYFCIQNNTVRLIKYNDNRD